MTTTVVARVDSDIKQQAQKLAQGFGFSLSTLINIQLRQFIRDKKITAEYDDTQPEYYNGPGFVNFEGATAKEVLDFLRTDLAHGTTKKVSKKTLSKTKTSSRKHNSSNI